MPREYGTLGLARKDLRDHIGWDLGAAGVMRCAARILRAPAVASRYSRLLVDCNRAPDETSLIPAESDGRVVPGNVDLSARERRKRIELFHSPYHERVDRMMKRACRAGERDRVRLVSVHSFTPSMEGHIRAFDLGVLFDDHRELAHRLGAALRRRGFSVRYNQPYSGLDGLIYSARRHGRSHGVGYVELEVNNALIRTPSSQVRVGREFAAALRDLA